MHLINKNKGFGTQQTPRVWLELVFKDSDQPSEFRPCNKQQAGVHKLAKKAASRPEVDYVLVIDGDADLENIQQSDIWADYGRNQSGKLA